MHWIRLTGEKKPDDFFVGNWRIRCCPHLLVFPFCCKTNFVFLLMGDVIFLYFQNLNKQNLLTPGGILLSGSLWHSAIIVKFLEYSSDPCHVCVLSGNSFWEPLGVCTVVPKVLFIDEYSNVAPSAE
eukprot:snap_masked-scaffold_4-processed-gene-18.30-mRNA-1 protein AED:1.00 eAED:1.00 QI:0/0/0/0/1/1/3/0/126